MCQNLRINDKNRDIVAKCDLKENVKLNVEITEAFKKTHPTHRCASNKECPFFYTKDMDLCPKYE